MSNLAQVGNRRFLDTAQRLSHQLRAAEDRIAVLEAEVEAYRQQAERAEQWLHKVYTEIEDRFLDRDKNALRSAQLQKLRESAGARLRAARPAEGMRCHLRSAELQTAVRM
jgi:chromosome segregation ATPase